MKRKSIRVLVIGITSFPLQNCMPCQPLPENEAPGETLPAGQTIPLLLSHDGAPDHIAAAPSSPNTPN